MKSEKEVIEALQTLKSVCKESGRCPGCILRNGDGYCGVIMNSRGDCYDKLTEWELRDYENPRLILN